MLSKNMGATKESWVKRKENGNGTPWNKGKKCPQLSKEKNHLWKGGEITLECRECKGYFKVKLYRKDTAHFCSQNCASQYKDQGKRTSDKKIRQSSAYKAWRTLVFERDNYKCIQCGDHNYDGRGKSLALHADHIKPFALYPELRFEVSNGRTLCVPCHKKTGTYGRGQIYRKVSALIASA